MLHHIFWRILCCLLSWPTRALLSVSPPLPDFPPHLYASIVSSVPVRKGSSTLSSSCLLLAQRLFSLSDTRCPSLFSLDPLCSFVHTTFAFHPFARTLRERDCPSSRSLKAQHGTQQTRQAFPCFFANGQRKEATLYAAYYSSGSSTAGISIQPIRAPSRFRCLV